jgi:hypothetical protein
VVAVAVAVVVTMAAVVSGMGSGICGDNGNSVVIGKAGGGSFYG